MRILFPADRADLRRELSRRSDKSQELRFRHDDAKVFPRILFSADFVSRRSRRFTQMSFAEKEIRLRQGCGGPPMRRGTHVFGKKNYNL
jgi:hypothetical protein